MAYYTAHRIADIPLHKIQVHPLTDHTLCIDTPTKVLAIVPDTTFRTYVRISAKCSLVYAVNADVDIRVAPRRLVCRNCIVRLPAHYMGMSVSLRNCCIESNSAIAVKTCIIECSTLSGIIVLHVLAYSKINNNRYSGNFAFHQSPQHAIHSPHNWHLHAITLKDTQVTGSVPVSHLTKLLYLNIARSMFTRVENSDTLQYLSIKQCALVLGVYPKLRLLNAHGATCIGAPPTCVVFSEGHAYLPEYLYKYSTLSRILLKIRRNDIRQQKYGNTGGKIAQPRDVPALQSAHEQSEHDAFYN